MFIFVQTKYDTKAELVQFFVKRQPIMPENWLNLSLRIFFSKYVKKLM